MIKIKKSDSIIDIIQKINEEKKPEIILDFPFWHPILHNYLSLKILKNKAWTKPISIITSDLTSRKIWKKIWINYSIVNDDKFIEHSQNAQLISHNMGFWEYFWYEIKSYIKLFISFFTKNSKLDEFKKYSLKYYNKSWVWVFLLIFFISFSVLFVVIFFVINKTYIKIKPEINIKTVAYNFIFKDFWDNDDNVLDDRIIKLKKISKIINLEENFQTSGINAWTWWKKSYWNVMLFNKLLEDITLKKNTRLEDKNWLIFIIPQEIKIPSWSQNTTWALIPWIVKVDVIAQDYDINWKYIWSRGNNIKKHEKFNLPWLKWDFKEKIYAEATNAFTWWNDVFQKVLWESDIETAKKLFENKLKKEAIKQMKEYISQQNSINNATYEILSYDDIFKDSKVDIIVPNDIKTWDKIESFRLKWHINFSSYIYNKSSVKNKLETIANNKIIKEENIIKWELIIEESEKFIWVDENSLRITNTIYENKKPRFEIKLTVEIDAYMYKNFLNKNSSYVHRLKNMIYWLSKKDAEKVLLNDKNIRSVDIDLQPFFINSISNIENNIIFEIEDPR